MWRALQEVCLRERAGLHELVTEIARGRRGASLTSSIRVYLLCYFRAAATEAGHAAADHGRELSRPGRIPGRAA